MVALTVPPLLNPLPPISCVSISISTSCKSKASREAKAPLAGQRLPPPPAVFPGVGELCANAIFLLCHPPISPPPPLCSLGHLPTIPCRTNVNTNADMGCCTYASSHLLYKLCSCKDTRISVLNRLRNASGGRSKEAFFPQVGVPCQASCCRGRSLLPIYPTRNRQPALFFFSFSTRTSKYVYLLLYTPSLVSSVLFRFRRQSFSRFVVVVVDRDEKEGVSLM